MSLKQTVTGIRIGWLPMSLVAGLLAVSLAFGLGSRLESREQVRLGEQVYRDNCAACHGSSGEGEVPQSPLEPGQDGLYPAPPHNETGHTWHHSDALLREIIREGAEHPGFKPMPVFGDRLSDKEIEAVIRYIKTLWTPEQRAVQSDISAQDKPLDER